MMWLPANVDAFRKMALLRVVPRSTRTFVFYEMAPGLMWAVIFHTQKNDLYLSQLADGPDERNHLERDLREQLPSPPPPMPPPPSPPPPAPPAELTCSICFEPNDQHGEMELVAFGCRCVARFHHRCMQTWYKKTRESQSLHSLGLTLHGGGRTRSLRVPVVGPLLKWGARPPPPAPRAPKGL